MNSWHIALAVAICLPLVLLALVIALVPKRRNPVIKDKPRPDARVYSIDRADKRAVKRWLK